MRTLIASLLLTTAVHASPIPSHIIDGRDLLELQRQAADIEKWEATYGTEQPAGGELSFPKGIAIVFGMPVTSVRIPLSVPNGQFGLGIDDTFVVVQYQQEYDIFEKVWELYGVWWEKPLDVTEEPDPQPFETPGPVDTPLELFIGPLKVNQYMLIPEAAGWILILAGLVVGTLKKR